MRRWRLAITDFALALNNSSYGVVLLARAITYGFGLFKFLCGNDKQHADAHVEGAQHFVLRNVTERLQVSKDGQHGPRSELDHGSRPAGQNARKIFGDASAGDVRQRRNALGHQQFLDDCPIAAVCLHELVADLALDLVDVSFRLVFRYFEQKFACQRIAVGMQSAGGQADDDVPWLDSFAGDDFFALDNADDEPGKIV